MFGVYLHIPFCASKCDYCAFATWTDRGHLIDAYLDALELEIGRALDEGLPVADSIFEYAARIVRATRPHEPDAPEFVKKLMSWGAGPRAGIGLISAAKAHAGLRGRFHATTKDVAAVATPVLRHRVLTTFNAEAAGVTSDEIIQRLLTLLAPKEDPKV